MHGVMLRLPALLVALLALAPGRAAAASDPPPPSAATRIRLNAGQARWKPGGVGAERPVPEALALYPGDVLVVDPRAKVVVETDQGASPPLAAPGTYRVTEDGVARVDELPTQRPPKVGEDDDLFATLRAVGGPVWLRDGPQARWVEVRGLASLRPGAEVKAGAASRAEVAIRQDATLRAGPGSQFTVMRRAAHLLTGKLAIEADRTDDAYVATTPDARIRGAGGLLGLERTETDGTFVHGFRGLWRIANRPAESEEPITLYLPPGKHTRVAAPRAAPAAPLRFDADGQLAFFTENWDQDRPPPPEPPSLGIEDDAALRHLREDQEAPAPTPPPPTQRELEAARKDDGRKKLSARERRKWLRLRVLASRSPALRRRYLDFRKVYADDREHPLPPGEPDRPRGYTEGATARVEDEQEVWLQARHRQNLRRREVSLLGDDRERRDMRHLERERFHRQTREELFHHEPLKYQTRALIAPTRTQVDALVAQARTFDQQARGLAGTPGLEAAVAELRRRRDAALRQADRLKDQLEELIELH